ncbi:NAD-dependent epimerase/dehydratase family protein [Paraburkholderia phenoliruptrix]|uniref:NAD-dependent epimerase/dehydratase family protein n=1 Tax=Paraburkholderia phenoliruptrix TaxID=252970 RepID=UPI002869C9E2|nr:NAD-dependent epimerase/dehydratase family protein [Paraburkholderia phenoliruptrix]WMY07501.1 NAD-dependent epimerase/dehydratase family protein [Paraburkholderia phenoliruptrix]
MRTLKLAGVRPRVLDRAGSLRGEEQSGVEYLFGDFSDPSIVAEALIDVDVVAHLVSTTVPGSASADPISDITGNLIGSVKFLEQMRLSGVRRIVYLSSGGTVYGNTEEECLREESATNPISSYGTVKLAIEKYLGVYGSQYGVRATVLRVSNPYGPNSRHIGLQGVIPTFFGRLIEKQPIRIWGTGENVRDYIYISDLSNAILKAIEQDKPGIYNVGSGIGISINEIIDIVSEVSSISPQIEFLPERPFDVKRVVLDVSKFSKTFDWAPTIGLREGCRMYWHWLNGAG